jgi:hypothetical protein
MRDIGHRIDLDLSCDATIAEVKALASELFGKPVLALKANRRLLRDDEYVRNLGLRPGTVVFVNPQVTASSRLPPEPRQIVIVPRALTPPVLPPRVVGWTDEAVHSRVQALLEMGFPREQCERAIEAAGCNVDRAADYLVSGFIPGMAVRVAPSTHEPSAASVENDIASFQKEPAREMTHQPTDLFVNG